MRDAADLCALLVLALALLAGAWWHAGRADLAVRAHGQKIHNERAISDRRGETR